MASGARGLAAAAATKPRTLEASGDNVQVTRNGMHIFFMSVFDSKQIIVECRRADSQQDDTFGYVHNNKCRCLNDKKAI
jgi:hypothetical protein